MPEYFVEELIINAEQLINPEKLHSFACGQAFDMRIGFEVCGSVARSYALSRHNHISWSPYEKGFANVFSKLVKECHVGNKEHRKSYSYLNCQQVLPTNHQRWHD